MSEPWTGKAASSLASNPHAALLRQLVEENEHATKKLQLYYALRCDTWQCDRCCQFYCDKGKLLRHQTSYCGKQNIRVRN
jgi:hypothetical protein